MIKLMREAVSGFLTQLLGFQAPYSEVEVMPGKPTMLQVWSGYKE